MLVVSRRVILHALYELPPGQVKILRVKRWYTKKAF